MFRRLLTPELLLLIPINHSKETANEESEGSLDSNPLMRQNEESTSGDAVEKPNNLESSLIINYI